MPGQFGLIQWSGNVFGAILNEITDSHACMWCIGSRFQALGPATANALHGCLKHLCHEDRLKAMDLPSLLYRRLRGDAIETNKYLHGEYQIADLAIS